MTSPRPLVLPALFVVALAASPEGLAAQGGSEPMPISVTVKPHMALPGAPVTLSGTTVADGKRFDVRVTVVKPNNQPAVGTARVDAQGNYTLTFTDDKQPGSYRVTALAPDGQGHDTTSFSVVVPQDFAASAGNAVHHLVDVAAEVEHRLDEAVKNLPESPARQEVEERIKTLEDSLRSGAQRVQQFRQAMQRLADVQTRYPETEPVFHDMYVHLGEEIFRTQAEADARKFEILNQLDASRAGGKICDGLETMSEGFKMVSATFNFASSLMNIVRGFLTDYVAARLPQLPNPALQNNPQGQFAMGEAIKGASNLLVSPTGWVGFLFTFAADLAAYFTDKEFEKYCERFEGPFTATMHGEVYRQGQTWWTMDIRLEGRLTLRYPKAKEGEAIHMSGQFEGAATDYKVWDDALPVLFPKLMQGTRTFKRVFPPVGIPYSDYEGRYAALASPTAFMVPVEGELVGHRLTIRLQPAKKDIPQIYNKARVVVAILSPLALIPVVTSYDLPYQNAEFVLKHGLDVDEGGPLVLEVEIGHDRMTTHREWQRTKPGDGVKAIYTGSVRLCNPACQAGAQ
jgi:hypothetical protein